MSADLNNETKNSFKKKRVDKIIFLSAAIFFCACASHTKAQRYSSCVPDKYNAEVWVPSKKDEVYDLKLKDTSQKIISLIFEMNFDDSIVIELNNEALFQERIKTISNLSVVRKNFEIDYSKFKESPMVRINLVEKKRCVEFKVVHGFRLLYLNYFDGFWNLERSNYPRKYY